MLGEEHKGVLKEISNLVDRNKTSGSNQKKNTEISCLKGAGLQNKKASLKGAANRYGGDVAVLYQEITTAMTLDVHDNQPSSVLEGQPLQKVDVTDAVCFEKVVSQLNEATATASE
ncbi:hypothetical protein ACOSP7_021151 [Xanthoceras sorbifolium]